jgi:uncharacterized membrane protein YfcA
MVIEITLLLIVLAFICEFIDSSMGQGYGTILSPALILLGFAPSLAVPSILISQAMGGLSASYWHHRLRNVDFSFKTKNNHNLRMALIIVLCGIVATIIGAVAGVKLPNDAVTIYIGILVIVIGILLLWGRAFIFSMKKIYFIGVLSAFNKSISGGAYGPVVAGGQMITGVEVKSAIGVTVFAEAPICIAGFITYITMKSSIDPFFLIPLCIGAVVSAPLGAYTTSKLESNKLKKIVGAIIFVLGIAVLAKIAMA